VGADKDPRLPPPLERNDEAILLDNTLGIWYSRSFEILEQLNFKTNGNSSVAKKRICEYCIDSFSGDLVFAQGLSLCVQCKPPVIACWCVYAGKAVSITDGL
jgi:hypothetical protein